jgi:hypothetical protein
MCTTIAVSERAPLVLPPPSLALLPLRESEPRTRMFIAPVTTGDCDAEAEADGVAAATLLGRSVPSAPLMSTLLMLLSRCQ